RARPSRTLSADADRNTGGEQALGPVSAGEPRRAWTARHTRPVPRQTRCGVGRVETHNLEELRVRPREVMVRHRRSEVAVMLPPRLAETILVTPGIDEAGLYADIVRRVRGAATGSGRTRLALRGLPRLAGSSPAAAAPTLAKLEWDDLAERARTIREPDKVRVLVELLRRHIARGEKVLVFTGFRQTLEVLVAAVERAGLPSASYHGSLTRREKESA